MAHTVSNFIICSIFRCNTQPKHVIISFSIIHSLEFGQFHAVRVSRIETLNEIKKKKKLIVWEKCLWWGRSRRYIHIYSYSFIALNHKSKGELRIAYSMLRATATAEERQIATVKWLGQYSECRRDVLLSGYWPFMKLMLDPTHGFLASTNSIITRRERTLSNLKPHAESRAFTLSLLPSFVSSNE